MTDPPAGSPWPAGARLVLLPDTIRFDGGRALFGGRPRRLLRLSEPGGRLLDDLLGPGLGQADRVASALGRRLCDAGMGRPEMPARAVDGLRAGVVVPVRDRADELDRCLASLGRRWPTVVVDDGSRRPEAVAAVADRHAARLLRLPVSLGPAAARNAGLAQLLSRDPIDVVAMVDSDVTVGFEGLCRLLRHFADPTVVAVGPRVMGAVASEVTGSRSAGWAPGFAAAMSPLDLGGRPGRVRPLAPVGHLPTACLLLRVAALPGAPFDQKLRYGEDVNLVWRLDDDGGRVWFDPTVVAHHLEPSDFKARLLRQFHYGASAGPLARRHPGRLAPLQLRPESMIAVAALATGRPTVSAGAIAVSAARAATALPPGLPPAATARVAGAAVEGVRRHARVVTQLGWPLLFWLAASRRLPRSGVAAVVMLDPLIRGWRDRAASDPLRWTLGCLGDDMAYGVGLAAGAIRSHTAEPVLPRLGRRSAAAVAGRAQA